LKTVLITGACGGLGNKMSKYFAEKGWQVIATVHHFDLVEGLTIHPNIKFYALDVTSTESIETAKKEILKDYKTIDGEF
jgi:NADP-dependent 3-hydroxy acid dehydrogenase YdfG